MEMKLFSYAVYGLFHGMGYTWDILLAAFVGIQIHCLYFIVRFLALNTDGEHARFWTLVYSVVASLIFIVLTPIAFVFIREHIPPVDDGVYHVEFDPDLLPPPPPEMDMC